MDSAGAGGSAGVGEEAFRGAAAAFEDATLAVGAFLAAGAADAEPRAAWMIGIAVDLEAGFSEFVWFMT